MYSQRFSFPDVLPHSGMFPWSPKVAFTHYAARQPSVTPRLAPKVIFPNNLKTSPSFREKRLRLSKHLMLNLLPSYPSNPKDRYPFTPLKRKLRLSEVKQLTQGHKPRNDKSRNKTQVGGSGPKAGAQPEDGIAFVIDKE